MKNYLIFINLKRWAMIPMKMKLLSDELRLNEFGKKVKPKP